MLVRVRTKVLMQVVFSADNGIRREGSMEMMSSILFGGNLNFPVSLLSLSHGLFVNHLRLGRVAAWDSNEMGIALDSAPSAASDTWCGVEAL